MSRLPGVFATTIEKSAIWLHEIENDTGWDEHRAYRALRAALHVLRDRLTVDQAAHLGAQLPMLVRGFYYEGWHPAAAPDKRIGNKDDFLACVRRECNDPQIDPELACCAVFGTLGRHVTGGEIAKLRNALPKSIAALLPDGNAAGGHHAPPPGNAARAAGHDADFIVGAEGIRPVQH